MELRMSRKERDRLKVVAAVAEGRLKQAEAAARVRLSVRQVRRILRRYEAEGDAGLVHRARGRPAANQVASEVVREIVTRLEADYGGFGPREKAPAVPCAGGIERVDGVLDQPAIATTTQGFVRARWPGW